MARKMQSLLALIAFIVIGIIATSSASATSWTILGGDPLFPGGIHGTGQMARNSFVGKMETSRGQEAMKLAGLSSSQRHALNHAFRTGDFHTCKLEVGNRFEAMSYGVGVIFVDRNVTYEDTAQNGAPAFCFSVCVNGVCISGKVPFKCVNFSITKRHYKVRRKPKARPPKQVNNCRAGQVIASNGNCVNQSNTSSETCGNKQEQSVSECTTVQINNNCGDVSINGSPTQGSNCTTCSGSNNCSETPSCPPGTTGTYPNCEKSSEPKCPEGTVGTYPKCEKPPPVLHLNLQKLQEAIVKSEEVICVTVSAQAGDNLSAKFEAEFGQIVGEAYEKSTDKLCVEYKAPSDPLKDGYKAVVFDHTTGQEASTETWHFPVKSEEEEKFYLKRGIKQQEL